MTLNELRYVVAIAQHQHFGRAAQDCFVSQSALSVGIKKLEDELGVVLFERGFGQVLPTSTGSVVVEYAQRVLDGIELLRQAASGHEPTEEPVRIGVIYTIGPYLLPNLIPTLRKRKPEMSLVVEDGFTFNLSKRLKQGSLDMIIISEPFIEPGLDSQPLYEEPFVVAMPAKHPLAKHTDIDAEMMKQESVLLLAPQNCFRDQVIRAYPSCLNVGQKGLQSTIETNSLETLRYIVASGQGITVLPASAAYQAVAAKATDSSLAIRPFKPPIPKRTVSIAWRSGYRRANVTTVLRQAIYKSLPKGATLLKRKSS